MPIYEYVCEACGRLTEVMQKMNDPAPAACPECGAAKLAKLLSRTTFQLKGGGWHADLYSSPKTKDGSAAKAKAGADGKPGAAEGASPAPAPAPAPAAGATGSAAPAGGGSTSGGSGSGGGPSPGGAGRKSG